MPSIRRGRLRSVAATAAMVTLVVACTGQSRPTFPVAPGNVTVTSERQLFGAFLGADESGIERMPEFEQFLGGQDLRVGHTYLPGDSWQDVTGAPQLLQPWSRWKAEHPNDLFVLNVPMATPNERPEQEARQGQQALTDDQVSTLLAAGANGDFDWVYRQLGERLVQLRLADAVIIPGWEMNGTTYSHRCGPNPDAWKQFFRHVVGTMRSVPGQRFLFDFNPTRGRDAIPWPQCYPGDDVVDIIGMDAYDRPQGLSFQDQVNEPYGLRDHAKFARERGKPISFPEWGLFENGDDPDYIRGMADWMRSNDTVYSTYTNYCPHAVLPVGPESSGCDNPQSAEALRELFSR